MYGGREVPCVRRKEGRGGDATPMWHPTPYCTPYLPTLTHKHARTASCTHGATHPYGLRLTAPFPKGTYMPTPPFLAHPRPRTLPAAAPPHCTYLYAPMAAATWPASLLVEWRLARAWPSRQGSKVASCTSRLQPRPAAISAGHGRVSPGGEGKGGEARMTRNCDELHGRAGCCFCT